MAEHDPHHTSPCEEALAELYTFLDGELTPAKRSAIAAHLEGCNPCVEIFDFEAELRMVISARATEAVPESLRLRITETIQALSVETGQSTPVPPPSEPGR